MPNRCARCNGTYIPPPWRATLVFVSTDRPDLVRYWFEFDVSGLARPRRQESGVTLDGDHPTHRLLWRGAGVTGFGKDDCLALLRDLTPDGELPPLVRADADIDVSQLKLDRLGNPAWRGVWFPALNSGGPAR